MSLPQSVSEVGARVTVEAQVIRKCPSCGDTRVRNNQFVSGPCPNCGGDVPELEDRGIIYHNFPTIEDARLFINSTIANLKGLFKDEV